MRKVVVTGPECSGKSVLSAQLAEHLGVPWVPEMARPYLEQLERPYGEADLRKIAELQLRTEEERHAAQRDASLLICDTDLITIRIWGEEKYGRSDPWIVKQTEERAYDLWLLCTPDIPWVYDPQRENPYDRDRLFGVYRQTLERLKKPYAVISGEEEERLKQAVNAIMESSGSPSGDR
ncbi:MAG TPA: ATP-binding protein [Flavobacteriales bacterium]|nr:ATP-binding protein [Flavobacteriales bacterium]HRN38461.1 ATP-binding protein [Flavobacteriales bacterium]HRO38842.1 ATP-binding protein [Flavobacteriales bacterium]HRP81665.1 ATP-binding protein [Flavobacteriales bacterium]HRQ84003.1 ATP-binding protein [Flavobacteriales bacterium]